MGLITSIIDYLYDYEFHRKYNNPFTAETRQVLFNSLLYKALQSDSKQAAKERKKKLDKMQTR